MNPGRLIWVFAAGFLIFGLPLFVVTNEWWRNLTGGLATLSLGLFAFAMAWQGLSAGEIKLQFNHIRRETQPRTFMAVIAGIFLTGIVVIVSALWRLFLA